MRTSKRFYKTITEIKKSDFLTSKITGQKYNTFGNFNKHLRDNNITIVQYWHKYYYDYVPNCYETNEKSDNMVLGYWNKWIPLKSEFKKLLKKTNIILRLIDNASKKGYVSEYLTIEYWHKNSLPLSKIINKLYYLFHPDNNFYLRLFDNWYYNENYNWGKIEKDLYIQSILNENAIKLKMPHSIDGLLQRGVPIEDTERIHNSWSKTFNTSFKNSDIQRKISNKRYLKYSKSEIYSQSVRRIEYWMKRGYSYAESEQKVSDIQRTNSIEYIKKYQKCTTEEAKKIQFEIYKKREETFSKKSQEELNIINSKKDAGSFDYCMRKCHFDIDRAKIMYNDLLEKRTVPFGRASKESLKYFIPFYKILRKNGIDKTDVLWGITGSREYFVKTTDNFFMYDFTIYSKKIIIEYDGVMWHTDDKYDKLKQQSAEKKGYKVYRIRSDLTDIENFNILTKILNEDLQITNTNWKII